MNRRQLLKSTAGVAAVGLAGASAANAQYTGLTPDGGTVPFRLPMGALDYLDQNQYIHNMEVISHLAGPRTAGGEPLMAMWAKGDDRLLPGGRGWVDVSDAKNPKFIETKSSVNGCVAYHTATKRWVTVVAGREPLTSATPEFPNGRWHKELYDKTVAYKGLRGIVTWDINDPANPKLLNEFSTGETGSGTHMNFYDGGKYAYLDAGWSDQFRMENPQRASGNGMMIVDMTDPEKVTEVARYHVPGQLYGEEEEYKKYWFAGDRSSWTCSHGGPVTPVRVEDGGRYGYAGFGHFGLITFDFQDIKNPKVVSQFRWDGETMGGIPYHTIYPILAEKGPLRNIIVGTPETIEADCREPYKPPQVLDISNPAQPKIIGWLPRPTPPKNAPFADYCQARGRFGTHNTQCWVAPGRAKPEILVTTWFNAGIRVHDLSDPTNPKEIAYFVPPRSGKMEDYESWRRGDSENVFVEWDRGIIWLGTHTGTWGLSCPALGKATTGRMAVKEWTKPHLNRGWNT